jgi:hypothetical protein
MKSYTLMIRVLPLLATGFLLMPFVALGAPGTYTPLVGIPGFPTTSGNLPQYINQLYKLTISIGGLIAVIKIIMAGVKYSMSGIVTDKEEAKHDIRGALLGLAILLIPFIVLNQIYPNLTNLNVLTNAVKTNLAPGASSPTNSSSPSSSSGGTTSSGGSAPSDADPNVQPLTLTYDNYMSLDEMGIAELESMCSGSGNLKTTVKGDVVTAYCTKPITTSESAPATSNTTSPAPSTNTTSSSGSTPPPDPNKCGDGNCYDYNTQ